MEKMPKCPYFNEPCLKEGCTAFSKRTKREDGQGWIKSFTLTENQPYCSVLNIFLPYRVEKEDESLEGKLREHSYIVKFNKKD